MLRKKTIPAHTHVSVVVALSLLAAGLILMRSLGSEQRAAERQQPAAAIANSDAPPSERHRFAGRLPEIRNPRFNPDLQDSSDASRNIFSSGFSREMVAAQGDPFLLSYLSGEPEGELVLEETADGPPVLTTAAASRASRSHAMLRHMDRGLLGSFSKFFSSVIAPSRTEGRASGREVAEDNPFLQALEDLEGSSPVPDSTTAARTAPPETPASVGEGELKETRDAALPKVAAGIPSRSVTTIQSYLFLRTTEEGLLESLRASQPRDGVFAISETDIRDYQVFPFMDPADTPFAMAAADFNGDARSDLVLHVPRQGALRLFHRDAQGSFHETLNVRASRAPGSIAAGDFNRDGLMDLAISRLGVGLITILYGERQGAGPPAFGRFESFFINEYRDFIAVAPEAGTHSRLEILGLTFGRRGQAIWSSEGPADPATAPRFDFEPALVSELETAAGTSTRLEATLLDSFLSIHIEAGNGQLWNVMNVSAGSDVFTLLGDLDENGTLDLGIAVQR